MKWSFQVVDIWGPTPQEKFNCQRKLHLQINYPYFENKILTFLISESKHDGWAVDFVLRLQSIYLLVRVTCPPPLVKKLDTLGVDKWSTNSLRHNTIAEFSKKILVEENKTQKWKKSAISEGEHWSFFWEIRKMEERKHEHISVWENLLRNIYFLLIKFSRIIHAGFHLCLFLSDVNQIFKDKLSIWMNRTTLFIVKGE